MNIPSLSTFQKICEKFPDAKWVGILPRAEGFIIEPADYHSICQTLKNEYGFTYLSCLTAKDMIQKNEFELIVHLENIEKNEIVWLKVAMDRDVPEVASITDLWKGADFLERETYDMFGIIFKGHPNLTRILSPEDETTYPLRKDFTKENNNEYGQKTMEKLLTL